MSGVRPSAKITGGGGIREAIYRGRVIDAQFEIAEALRPLGERHDLRREGRRLKQHALRGIVRRLGAILQLRLSLLVACPLGRVATAMVSIFLRSKKIAQGWRSNPGCEPAYTTDGTAAERKVRTSGQKHTKG